MENNKNKMITRRALTMMGIFALAILFMFSRFVYIQASKEVQDVDLQQLLENRWTQTVALEGERGNILDRNGEVLAEEIPSYTIVAVLDDRYDSHVENPSETAEALSSVLEIDREFLESQLSRDSVQVELGPSAKNMSYETKEKIEALELPGITFREDPRRYYPKQTFASHIIGYTERDMSEARMGLENSLDEYLQDEPGSIEYQKDGKSRRLANAEEFIDEPKNGSDVVLTLDSRIQTAMEQTMNQVDELYEPERMMAIVANAKTGEILGMSNRPSFNPNEYENIENFTNFNISSRFEPGSTMKIFTLAAAIEEGVYDGEDTFDSGTYKIYDRTIRDHNQGEGWGEITFNEGVQRSSNVAFSIIAMEILGPEKLYEYIDKFGFRTPTGIDLPNEIEGGSIAESYPIDAATTAFGQATSISPMQQVQAATAIANDGKMMKPYVVSEIVDAASGEAIKKTEPEIAGEPISAETAEQVREIMETVVTEEAGTGQPYAVEGFDIAGKTGTAQIPRESGGGYITGNGQNIFSFIGMAPASDPEVIVYVAVDRPQLEGYQLGNEPVSMIFKQIMEQSLQYLNIAPSEEDELQNEPVNNVVISNLAGENIQEAEQVLEDEGIQTIILGEGESVVAQSHEEGSTLASQEKVILLTEGKAEMPDITGWSLRSVQQAAALLEIEVEAEGIGFVIEQKPDYGKTLENVKRIAVTLGDEELEEDSEEEEEEVIEEGTDEENEQNFIMD
ncbi:penicillin-binding protein [Alkalicoccus daliensis]|uniref:serine-type D-Ala-D-Ala carboxypeptidase n=1 Tax=Alkalicoccus daliensis TaxID=745820 RepID=A0A1G9ZUM8_9BACI|nr:penicillin-binding protein [Alkalicoccus daliensis]SDN24930.1 penicillin-binding protein 2B [Alkalicoccus daliensis]